MSFFSSFSKAGKLSDLTGILSSSACLVHCLATPLLIAAGANFLTHSWVEYVFIGIAFLAIYHATKHSSSLRIAALLWLSFLVLAISLLLEEAYPAFEYCGYLSAAGIIAGHILNIRHCARCAGKETAVEQVNAKRLP
jgi:hypothetical protein